MLILLTAKILGRYVALQTGHLPGGVHKIMFLVILGVSRERKNWLGFIVLLKFNNYLYLFVHF